MGNEGEVLSLRPTIAYRDFLMPGLAVYASPENLEKYQVDESKPKAVSEFSSPYVQRVRFEFLNIISKYLAMEFPFHFSQTLYVI